MNKYKPHVYILPEDDANAEIVTGFLLHASIDARYVQVLPPAKGWIKLLEEFEANHKPEMLKNVNEHMIMVLDFDRDLSRREKVRQHIGDELIDRVFVLGSLSEPEALRSDLGSYETIGQLLANECNADTRVTWNHDQLTHNYSELDRMTSTLKPILFN